MTRALLVASLLLGFLYPAIWRLELPGFAALVAKGAPVAFLALWAAVQASERNGWLLAAILGVGAVGDVLLEIDLTLGGAVFALGHCLAIGLYLTNRRARLTSSQRALALMIVPLTAITAWLLPADRTAAPGIALYGAIVAAMAAFAWTSRFPRYRVGLGAMFFVASDLLIFARLGPLAGAAWVSYAVWWGYYAGQLLIAIGVRGVLDDAAPTGGETYSSVSASGS